MCSMPNYKHRPTLCKKFLESYDGFRTWLCRRVVTVSRWFLTLNLPVRYTPSQKTVCFLKTTHLLQLLRWWWWWWLFPCLWRLGENVQPFVLCLHLFSFFSFEVEITSGALIPLFMPGSVHSGSESWDDCGWMFPNKLQVSSFPDWFPHYAVA